MESYQSHGYFGIDLFYVNFMLLTEKYLINTVWGGLETGSWCCYPFVQDKQLFITYGQFFNVYIFIHNILLYIRKATNVILTVNYVLYNFIPLPKEYLLHAVLSGFDFLIFNLVLWESWKQNLKEVIQADVACSFRILFVLHSGRFELLQPRKGLGFSFLSDERIVTKLGG